MRRCSFFSTYRTFSFDESRYWDLVIKKASEGKKLKVISKYGIGLDKIDLEAAKKHNIPVTNCPGVNHVTVAEHVFALMLSFYKNIHLEHNITKQGRWKRLIGHEIFGKKIGILGLGKIGKEVAIRAKVFGLDVFAFDKYIDEDFVKQNMVKIAKNIDDLISQVEIISINMPLTSETEGVISLETFKNYVNKNSLIINTSRAKVVDLEALKYALDTKIISGYLTDVMDEEPMPENHPLTKYENVIITPHIGSRTFQSVARQGTMAVNNLLEYMK